MLELKKPAFVICFTEKSKDEILNMTFLFTDNNGVHELKQKLIQDNSNIWSHIFNPETYLENIILTLEKSMTNTGMIGIAESKWTKANFIFKDAKNNYANETKSYVTNTMKSSEKPSLSLVITDIKKQMEKMFSKEHVYQISISEEINDYMHTLEEEQKVSLLNKAVLAKSLQDNLNDQEVKKPRAKI